MGAGSGAGNVKRRGEVTWGWGEEKEKEGWKGMMREDAGKLNRPMIATTLAICIQMPLRQSRLTSRLA